MSNVSEGGQQLRRLRGGSASSASNPTTPPHQHHNRGGPPPGGGTPGQRPSKPCCLCWCCCCKCSCKPGGNLPTQNPDPFNGEPAPTLEEIRSWGSSFDRLMRSSAGRKVFRDFLRCEYSEENILFWQACEELKRECHPDTVEEKARIIYEDYISILSPKEVSLDSRVREIVNKNMVNPTPHTFDDAQLQIYTLMHRDSYPRFVNSSLYKQLAQLNNSDGGGPSGNGNGRSSNTRNGGGGGSGAGSPTTTQEKTTDTDA